MRQRSITKYHPDLERLEAKQVLSGVATTPPAADPNTGPTTHVLHQDDATPGLEAQGTAPNQDHGPGRSRGLAPTHDNRSIAAARHRRRATSKHEFELFRITNPEPNTSLLIPPFQQVLVQRTQPVRGQVYNILSITVRNGTRQTYDASSGFFVKLTGQAQSVPILTGNQQWKPGQVLAFYVLTKQYYPVSPRVSGGFEFDLGGSRGVAIPGPSGIFLGVKYNPATFPNVLNFIIANGPGSKGHVTGLADTAIWQFNRVRH